MIRTPFSAKEQVFIILLSMICLGYSWGQTDKKKKLLEIRFEHFVGSEVLKLDSVTYINPLGQDFTVTKFNYYISDIRLTRNDGKEFVSPMHFLIKEDEPSSKRCFLEKIPPGEYTSIQFSIGVDSIKNCSGIQSGALDPINGMFWTWNTGYIFLKLEGKSTASSMPNGTLEYHIGGFKQPNNCIKTISLALEIPLIITKKKSGMLILKTDVMELLKSPTDIDFSKVPVVTGVENSQMISNNYQDIFTIIPLERVE
jgi:hypothetical protein